MSAAFFKMLFFVVLGYCFAIFDKNKENTNSVLNKYLYFFGLPAIIFFKTSSIDLASLDLNFLILNILPACLVMFFVFILWKLSVLSINLARTLIIAGVLGNTVYLGFPAVSAILGEGAIGYAAVIASLHNITVFIVGLILLNLIYEDNFTFKTFVGHILKNPVLMSSAAALILALFSLKIPSVPADLLSEISKTVIPLSLLSLGIALHGKINILSRRKEIFFIVFLKLFLLPFIAALTIYILNSQTLAIKASFIQHTMPVAVMTYIVSKEMELDTELVSHSITFTTICYFAFFPLYSLIQTILF